MTKNAFDIGRLVLKIRTAKKWWLPPAILLIAAVNVLGLFKPKQYTASALVLINQTQSNDAHLNEAFRLGDILSSMKQRIYSYVFLSEIARSLNMDAGIVPDSKEYAGLIAVMQKNLDLQLEADHFAVSYSGYTPQEAYKVTDGVVKLFITQTSEYYNSRTGRSEGFLETQLAAAHMKVIKAQSDIRDYKDAHINEIPEALPGYTSQMARQRDALQQTRQDLLSTSVSLKQAMAALEKEPQTITSEKESQTADRSNDDLKKQQRDLKLKIQTMKEINGYTDSHWEIIAAKKSLAMIDEQLSSTTQKIDKETITTPNQNYQILQTKITDYQLRITGLHKQQSEQEADIKRLEEYMAAIPKNQDALATLNRALSTAEAEELSDMNALNLAHTASALEAQGMGPSFTYYSPPRVPAEPSSPNRVKIAGLSVFLGGAAAAGMILLLALFDSSLRSVDEARQVLQMPVLGIVQSVVTATQLAMAKRRRRRIWTGLATAIAVIIVAGAVGFTRYHDDILLGVDHLRDVLKRW